MATQLDPVLATQTPRSPERRYEPPAPALTPEPAPVEAKPRKRWAEVQADPRFQSLSSDEQEAARSQYFDEVVKPQLGEADLAEARKQFDASTKVGKLSGFAHDAKQTLDKAADAAGPVIDRGLQAAGKLKDEMASEFSRLPENPTVKKVSRFLDETRPAQLARDGIVSRGRQQTAVNTRLPTEARALLDTIAGTESPGYNTRYGGKTFEGFADHPRIGQRIERGPNAGKVSRAAGRYQFITGTWDAQAKKLGLKDFSPENQDLAAWDLAEEVYKSKTNRNLLEDLRSTDPAVHANVGRVLSDTWTSLPGGIEATTHGSRFSKEFNRNLQRESGQPQTAGAEQPQANNLPEDLKAAAVKPAYVDTVRAKWDAADAGQRASMLADGGVLGRVARHVKQQYDDTDAVMSLNAGLGGIGTRREDREDAYLGMGLDLQSARKKADEDLALGVPTKIERPRPSLSEQIGSDWQRGILNTQAMGAGLGAWAMDVAGQEDKARALLTDYQNLTQEAGLYAPVVGDFANIGQGGAARIPEDVARYLTEAVVANLPNFLPSLALGGLGGIAARKAAQGAVTGLVDKLGAAKAAEFIAEKAAAGAQGFSKIGKTAEAIKAQGAAQLAQQGLQAALKDQATRTAIGAAAGAGAASVGMETGSIYGDIYDQTGQMRPGVAGAAGLAAGALDAIPAMRAATKLVGPEVTSQVAGTVMSRLGREAGIQFLSESGTEFVQTLIENGAVHVVDGKPLVGEQDIHEALNAALQGGIAGGTIGAATQGVSEARRAADLPATAQIGAALQDSVNKAKIQFWDAETQTDLTDDDLARLRMDPKRVGDPRQAPAALARQGVQAPAPAAEPAPASIIPAPWNASLDQPNTEPADAQETRRVAGTTRQDYQFDGRADALPEPAAARRGGGDRGTGAELAGTAGTTGGAGVDAGGVLQREPGADRPAEPAKGDTAAPDFGKGDVKPKAEAPFGQKIEVRPLPKDFAISDKTRDFLGRKGFSDLEPYLKKFKEYHATSGIRMENWDGKFHQAVLHDIFNLRGPGTPLPARDTSQQGTDSANPSENLKGSEAGEPKADKPKRGMVVTIKPGVSPEREMIKDTRAHLIHESVRLTNGKEWIAASRDKVADVLAEKGGDWHEASPEEIKEGYRLNDLYDKGLKFRVKREEGGSGTLTQVAMEKNLRVLRHKKVGAITRTIFADPDTGFHYELKSDMAEFAARFIPNVVDERPGKPEAAPAEPLTPGPSPLRGEGSNLPARGQESTGTNWDELTPSEREARAAKAGWRTQKGAVNAFGKKLALQAWADIKPEQQAKLKAVDTIDKLRAAAGLTGWPEKTDYNGTSETVPQIEGAGEGYEDYAKWMDSLANSEESTDEQVQAPARGADANTPAVLATGAGNRDASAPEKKPQPSAVQPENERVPPTASRPAAAVEAGGRDGQGAAAAGAVADADKLTQLIEQSRAKLADLERKQREAESIGNAWVYDKEIASLRKSIAAYEAALARRDGADKPAVTEESSAAESRPNVRIPNEVLQQFKPHRKEYLSNFRGNELREHEKFVDAAMTQFSAGKILGFVPGKGVQVDNGDGTATRYMYAPSGQFYPAQQEPHAETRMFKRAAEQTSAATPEESLTAEPEARTVDGLAADFGVNNTLFTKERADRAREILRKKLSQLNSGFDPEIAAAGLELAGYYIEGGARDFAAYTKAMVAGLGEAVRPYLRSFYESARHYPGLDNTGMDDAAAIERALAEEASPGKKSRQQAQERWETLSPGQKAAWIKQHDITSVTPDTPWDRIHSTLQGVFTADVVDGKVPEAETPLSPDPSPLRGEGDAPLDRERLLQVADKLPPTKGDALRELLKAPDSPALRRTLAAFSGSLMNQFGPLSEVIDKVLESTPATKPPAQEPVKIEDRDEYPLGRFTKEDRYFGTRVRVLPDMRDDVAWEGTVYSVLNGGRLFEVRKDGQDFQVRISGQRIEVLEVVDSGEPASDKSPNLTDTSTQPPKKRRVSKQAVETRDVDRETTGTTGRASNEGPGAGPVPGTVAEQSASDVSGREGGGNRGGGRGAAGTGNDQDTGVRSGTARTAATSDRNVSANLGTSAANVPDVPRGNDYRIPAGGLTREGSWLDTARRNVEIVELVHRLESENRPATPEEQAQLVKFTGWGAADIRNQLFPGKAKSGRRYDPSVLSGSWKELGQRVAEVFTADDWKTALRSTQYAHYTSEEVVRAAWQGAERLGFAGGAILEPGAGIGHFAGLMPDGIYRNSRYLGIEQDGFTARIAQLLYPGQTLRHADYVRNKVPRAFFDLAIGNPPFANTPIVDDPEYARQKFPLHDYFFAKSMDRVRPGGLLIFVTSRYTLDKQGDKARRYLSERADLLGAIRLPNTAFKANAGTQVVTDVLFLRKRDPSDTATAGESWLGLGEVKSIEGDAVPVNEYFARHPEMILGQITTKGDTLNPGEAFTLNPLDDDLAGRLAEAIQRLPQNVYSVADPAASTTTTQKTAIEKDWNPKYRKEGGVYLSDAGELMRVENGVGVALADQMKLSAKEKEWLTDYVPVREALKQAQYDQLAEGNWQASLKALNKAYDAFVKKHGPIMAFTESETTKLDADGEEEIIVRRRYKNDRMLKADIDGKSLVFALEKITEDGAIVKAAILKDRVLKRPAEPKIESVDDALAVSLAQAGRFDLAHVARLAGMEPEQALRDLGDLVYEAPGGGQVLAEEYLSGDVRTKLDEAEAAAAIDRKFARNVEALSRVQPPSLVSSDVTVGLGATWVPMEYYQQYAQEVVGLASPTVTYHAHSNEFEIASNDRRQLSRSESAEWGTKYRSPLEIFDAAMNRRTVKVYVGAGTRDDPRKLDPEETKKVETLVRRMEENFSSWVWTDAERTGKLLDVYNDKFNRLAPRFFNGDHIQPPGLSLKYTLHPHQKRAIWRAIVTGNTYFAHAVGAGKTLEMIIAGMEQKRLGLIKKPMYVVPNHMLEQFAAEFLEAYPAANIMVADQDNFAADNRRRFIAQASLNNPDAIVITHSAFTILEMKPENQAAAFDDVIDDLRASLEELPDDFENKKTRSKIEAQLERIERAMSGSSSERFTQRRKLEEMQQTRREMEEQIAKLGGAGGDPSTWSNPPNRVEQLESWRRKLKEMDGYIALQEPKARKEELNAERDKSVLFEDMGVDFLFVDEAHDFRKLDFSTKMNVKGLSPEGSVMALKLFVKTRWLEKQRKGRSFAFASGTPITNTMAELFTIQRFFQEDELRAKGLIHFDAWAANFARVKTEYERNATGGWEGVDRMSKFVNVADLMTMMRQHMDVLTSSELAHLVKLPTPVPGNAGKRNILVTPQIPELEAYMNGELSDRLEASRKWKPSKEEPSNPDPVIAIITDGRVAALDMRYIDPSLPNNPDSKLNKLADRIIEHYRETANLTFTDPDTGKIEPIKGGTQIVFAGLGFGPGIGKSRGFDGRAWLNKRLKEAGIPSSEVAWIWDYPTPAAKQAMFKEMRQGKKRILIGSPKNMGTGVNVQKRLTHKIDLDSPWYPSDMEQPDGRILRQGNQNEFITLEGLATDGTYDSTMYSMVARKSAFIEQAFRGDRSLRVMDDISESSGYAMAAAIASGDPRYMQMATLESDVAKLEGAKELHDRRQVALRRDISGFKRDVPILRKEVETAQRVAAALQGSFFYSGRFGAVVDGREFRGMKSTELGEEVANVLDREMQKAMAAAERLALGDQRSGKAEHHGPRHTHEVEQVIGKIDGKAELVLLIEADAARVKKDGKLTDEVSRTFRTSGTVQLRVAGQLQHVPVDTWRFEQSLNRHENTGRAITGQLGELQYSAVAKAKKELDDTLEALEKAEKGFGTPFPQQAELVQAVTELANLRRELSAEGKEVPEAAVKASVLPDFSLIRPVQKGGEIRGNYLAAVYGLPEEARDDAPKFSRRAGKETITVDGKERPRLNSEGRPIHPTEAGIRNFWRWFGDSRVVDGDGRPLVVYHGTTGKRTVFEPYWKQLEREAMPHELEGDGSIAKMYRLAKSEPELHFFFVERGSAETYGDDVTEAYLKITDPVIDEDRDAAIDGMLDGDKDGASFNDTTSGGRFGGRAWAVRASNQIKSATENSGAFSSDNDDIRFSKQSRLDKSKRPKGITHDRAQQAIDEFRAGIPASTDLDFEIVDDVPAHIQSAIGPGERVKGYFVARAENRDAPNKVVIVRNTLDSVQDATETLRHEVLGHYGLNLFPPDVKAQILNRVIQSRNLPTIASLYNSVEQDYEQEQDPFKVAEEVFARIAQSPPSRLQGWMEGLEDLVVRLLRKVGFLRGPLTRREIRKIIAAIGEGIEKGAVQRVIPKTTRHQFAKSGASTESWEDVDADTLFAAIDGAGKDGGGAWGRAGEGFENLSDKPRRQVLGLLTVHQLVEQGGKVLPRMDRYLDEMNRMDATRGRIIHEADAIAADWRKLDAKTKQRLAYVMHESTIAGVDGAVDYQPSIDVAAARKRIKALYGLQRGAGGDKRIMQWQEEIRDLKAQIGFEEQREREAGRIHALWAALSDDAKTVYVASRKFHEDQSERVEKALIAMIERAEMTGKRRAAAIQQLKKDFEAQRVQAPYFPLARQGDYWVSVAPVTDEDGKVIEPAEFHTFQSYEQQSRFFEERGAEGRQVARGLKTENLQEVQGVSAGFVADTLDVIGQLGDTNPAVEDVRDQVYQLYLKSLPELSSRKHAIHRKKTKGFGEDALRAFAEKASHDAYAYARIQHGFELRQIMESLDEDLKAAGSSYQRGRMRERREWLEEFRDDVLNAGMGYQGVEGRMYDMDAKAAAVAHGAEGRRMTPGEQFVLDEAKKWRQFFQWMKNWASSGRGPNWVNEQLRDLGIREDTVKRISQRDRGTEFAGHAYAELQQAYKHLMNPTTGRFAVAINSVGYLFHLAASPAAWVTNALQTPVISMPFVAARHGLGKTSKAFTKAYGQAMRDAWKWKTGKEHRFGIFESLTEEDERNAYTEALDRGLIERGRVMDLIGTAEEGASRSETSRRWALAMSVGFHDAERLNREVSFMAAYRLERGLGASFETAVNYAAKVVTDTHFNYAAENRARFMRSDAARVITQFKSYAQHITYLQWRAVSEALGQDATAEQKQEARRFLLASTAVQFAAAGAAGLPLNLWLGIGAAKSGAAAVKRFGLAGALAWTGLVIGAMVGLGGDDPDDPIDWGAEIRQALRDAFGPTGGTLVSEGLFNALAGIDLSSRLSQRELWWRDIDAEVDDRQLPLEVLSQMLGAGVGTGLQILEGLRIASDGQVERGIEKMLPKMPKDLLQAARFADEGALSLKGDPLIESFTPWEISAKASGFTPSRLAARYQENQANVTREKRIEERRADLTRDLAQAKIDAAMANRAGDAEKAEKAQKSWDKALAGARRYNEKQPRFPITGDTLGRSIQSRVRARASAQNGIFLNRKIPKQYDYATEE